MNSPDNSTKRPVLAGGSKTAAAKRKPATDRQKDLELAISRVKRGRARTKETTISISSVAREAGVTPALIHNHYPEIAEAIREILGRSSRAQRDAKHSEVKAEREKSRALRAEVDSLRSQVAKLASINEVLVMENRIFKAKQGDPKVVDLKARIG